VTPASHIGGMPLEEALPMLLPTAGILALVARARLKEIAAWRRRR
jgi:hypothetical protein